MEHFVVVLYYAAFAAGFGALLMLAVVYGRYRTQTWLFFGLLFIAVLMMVGLDTVRAYARATHTALDIVNTYRPVIMVPIELFIVVLMPLCTHIIVSRNPSAAGRIGYGVFFCLYAAGLIIERFIVSSWLSVCMDIAFASVVAYCIVVLAVQFSSVKSDLMRMLLVSLFVLSALFIPATVATAVFPAVHDILSTCYYLLLSTLTIFISLRYLVRGEVIREAVPQTEDRPSAVVGLYERFKLSPRERELISYIANGYTNRRIAERTGIAHQTVKNHVYNAYQKMEVRNRDEFIELLITETGK